MARGGTLSNKIAAAIELIDFVRQTSQRIDFIGSEIDAPVQLTDERRKRAFWRVRHQFLDLLGARDASPLPSAP